MSAREALRQVIEYYRGHPDAWRNEGLGCAILRSGGTHATTQAVRVALGLEADKPGALSACELVLSTEEETNG